MRNRTAIIVIVLTLGWMLPAAAGAATPSKAATAAASKTATRTYDLDFTLPTAGKSGCLVCHGDPNLVRPSGEATRSLFVNAELLQTSAHKDTPCTGCHIDFAYKIPHQNVSNGGDWRAVAKQACKNCHDEEFALTNVGSHSTVGKPGEDADLIAAARLAEGKPAEVPLCGDCHGSHEIMPMSDRSADAVRHRGGLEMCGQCHTAESDAYVDYYHGAAYRRGALDAPACWDCHSEHEMHPADDRLSPVNSRQLVKTCGECHENVSKDYVTYARMIHRRADIESGIPIYGWWGSAQDALRQAFSAVTSIFVSK